MQQLTVVGDSALLLLLLLCLQHWQQQRLLLLPLCLQHWQQLLLLLLHVLHRLHLHLRLLHPRYPRPSCFAARSALATMV